MSRFNTREGLYELLVKRVEEINTELNSRLERMYSHLDTKADSNQKAIRSEINGLREEIKSLVVHLEKFETSQERVKDVREQLEQLEKRHYELSNRFNQSFGRGTILTSLITAIVVSAFTLILTQYLDGKNTSQLLLRIHVAQVTDKENIN